MKQEGAKVASDRAEILRGLMAYHRPGDTFEIRIPGAGKLGTISGYFTDFTAAADSVLGRADEFAVYVTINPTNPKLIARANNRLKPYAKSTTSDSDIVKLNWLPMDGDPPRPAGIPSTDDEHDLSLRKCAEIRDWLISNGWPTNAFVRVDSGNGGYLLARIELENTTENHVLVERCLKALDYLYSDEGFTVDTTSANPARILRVPGTTNAKGDEVGDMRHRMARILEVPDSFEVVPKELLEALAAMLPEQDCAAQDAYTAAGKGFDPVAYCQAHKLQVHHTKIWTDPRGIKCTVAVLEQCVFNPDHHKSAVIIGWPNGMRSYRCRHNSCLSKHWRDAKAVIEPRAKDCDPKQGQNRAPKGEGAVSHEALKNCPTLEDLTKATGRMKRINSMTGEAEPDPVTGEIMVPKLTLSPTKASAAVVEFIPLRLSATDKKDHPKIWRYDNGVWQPDGEKQVINQIDAIIGDLSYERGLKETLRRVQALSGTVIFDADPCLFPALDDVIDLRTGETRAFQPEDYLTFRYGAPLKHPDADYRPVLWFLCSIFPDPRDVLTALDIAGAAVIRQAFEAIIQLIGPGGNGKGIFEKILSALCTADRVAALTLTEAKASRFGPAALLGKDLWILSEVEDVKSTINLLKKVSTGEMVDSDQKYGDRVRGKPHVLPILDCNNAIDFGDDSWGRKRRVIKLDFPYTFDYMSDTRPKDPHLEEKLTSPAALAGLLQIITARAPFLCKSKKIYTRKRPEEMAEEYRRQQYSLHFFCEECLSTSQPVNEDGKPIDVKTGLSYPADKAPRLTTDALYAEYREYCSFFNVPVPAEKGQVGKYINEKFGVTSTVTTIDKFSVRFYPGLWLTKTARLAHAELSLNYSNYTETTDKLQNEEGKNGIIGLLTTETTEEWPKEVIEEIGRMFCYIQSCQNPQDISYEGYLKNGVVSVVTVVSGREIAIPEKSLVVLPSLSCSLEGDPVVRKESSTIEADLQRTEEQRREKEAHDRAQAAKYTGKRPKSYSEMARSVPFDTSSPEAVKICRSFRGQLMKGIAPRIEFLVKETGLPKESIESYLNNAPWIRKDESSPAGIVVYLPSEASA